MESLSDNPRRFPNLSAVYVEKDGRRDRYDVESCKLTPKGWLVKLAAVNDRDAAELLRGCYFEIESSELDDSEEGSAYDFEIIGMDVFTENGERLGRVERIERYPANDVFVVIGELGRCYVPAIRDVVKDLDKVAGRMEIRLINGLEFERDGN